MGVWGQPTHKAKLPIGWEFSKAIKIRRPSGESQNMEKHPVALDHLAVHRKFLEQDSETVLNSWESILGSTLFATDVQR